MHECLEFYYINCEFGIVVLILRTSSRSRLFVVKYVLEIKISYLPRKVGATEVSKRLIRVVAPCPPQLKLPPTAGA